MVATNDPAVSTPNSPPITMPAIEAAAAEAAVGGLAQPEHTGSDRGE